jgi:predicted permease
LERSVDPGYFDAIQIPLLRGRFFTAQEGLRPADSVIVSQAFVKQYFPGEDPIGRQLELNPDRQRTMEIVGVVGDTRYVISEPPQPMIYLPLSLGFRRSTVLVIRSGQDVSALALAVQRTIQSLDRDLPVASVLTMDQLIGASTIEASFTSTLIVAFALIALLLAAVGLYGVLSYLSTLRVKEIGVRIAIGAKRQQVLQLMLFDGLKPAAIGIGFGLMGGVLAARLIRTMLYGVGALDPLAFAAAIGAVGLFSVCSCLVPAWRASRIDPMDALRSE